LFSCLFCQPLLFINVDLRSLSFSWIFSFFFLGPILKMSMSIFCFLPDYLFFSNLFFNHDSWDFFINTIDEPHLKKI
jgi:hypothetical protein